MNGTKTPSLANYWHPIAPAAEIAGAPRAYTLLGERLVAFRLAGELRVFKDLCVHRGTALSLGTVADGALVCAYHGWRFDRAGRCVHIPSLPEGAAVPAKARATVYRAAEAHGLAWVALAEPAQPVPSCPRDPWADPAWRAFVGYDRTWRASAGRAVENAMDLAHLNFVHRGLTELGDGPVVKPHDVAETAFGLAFAYDDGRIRREYELHAPFTLHDTKLVLRADRGGTWSEGAEPHRGDATVLSFIATPVDAETTRMFVLVARNHAFDMDDADYAAGLERIMEQDRRIVESQRPGELPVALRDELHLKIPDAVAVAYRRVLGRIDRSAPFAG